MGVPPPPPGVEAGAAYRFLSKSCWTVSVGFPYQQRPLFPVIRRVEYLCQQGTAGGTAVGTAYISYDAPAWLCQKISLPTLPGLARPFSLFNFPPGLDSTQSFLLEKSLCVVWASARSVRNDVSQARSFESKSPPFVGVRSWICTQKSSNVFRCVFVIFDPDPRILRSRCWTLLNPELTSEPVVKC